MRTVEVPRPPRTGPRLPGGELTIEPPPEPERPVPPALLARLLPAVMLLGSVGFVALGPRDPSSLMFGGMFALSTVGMLLVGGGGRSAGQRQASVDEERRDYLRYLAATRRRVRTVATEQRAALEHVHPDPAAWPAVLAAGRLWERRGADPDFGVLRAGTGPQRLATTLVAPPTGPVEGLEPVTALALRRFLRAHAVVPALPVALSLRGTGAIWLEAAPGTGPEPARALARALVAQYVLWHSPADAQLAVVAPPYLAPEWEWVKWLPHAGHPRYRDAAGPARMVTAQADDVRRWWEAELAGRAPGTAADDPAPARGRRRGGRARLVGRRGRNDGAAHRRAAGQAADASRRAPRSWGRSTCPGRTTRERSTPSAGRTHFPSRRPRPWPAASPATGPPEPVPHPVRPPRPACPSCSVWAGEHRAGRRSARRRSTPCAGAAGTPRTGCTCRSARRGRSTRDAGSQGVRGGRQRAARPLRGRHGFGQERVAEDTRPGPGGHALVGRAEPRARRLQGRRHLPRPRWLAARVRGHHEPGGRAAPRRPHGGRARRARSPGGRSCSGRRAT